MEKIKTKQTKKTKVVQSFFIVIFIFVLNSCATVYEISEVQVHYPKVDKMDLNILLFLTNEFRNTMWQDQKGEVDLIQLGEHFTKNAEKLSNTLFSNVLVTSDSANHTKTQINAILTPRVVSIKKSYPLIIFQPVITTFIFEWSLKDKKGDLIWIDTITLRLNCDGCTAMGASGKIKNHGQKIVEELFQQSFDAISSSQEIKEFAANKQ